MSPVPPELAHNSDIPEKDTHLGSWKQMCLFYCHLNFSFQSPLAVWQNVDAYPHSPQTSVPAALPKDSSTPRALSCHGPRLRPGIPWFWASPTHPGVHIWLPYWSLVVSWHRSLLCNPSSPLEALDSLCNSQAPRKFYTLLACCRGEVWVHRDPGVAALLTA